MIPIPTYFIYKNLLGFCSGSPAPWVKYYLMTITFESNNDVIVYALKKILSYARNHQYIVIAQCVWWLASSIGLREGLITYIDTLRIQSETGATPIGSGVDIITIHPDRTSQIETTEYKHLHSSDNYTEESSEDSVESSSTSENQLQDQVLQNCEAFLRESELARKAIARQNLRTTQRLPKQCKSGVSKKVKPKKSYKEQTEGIEKSELDRRKVAGECQRCAWLRDRKGAHKTLNCFRWARTTRGTAPFSKARTSRAN